MIFRILLTFLLLGSFYVFSRHEDSKEIRLDYLLQEKNYQNYKKKALAKIERELRNWIEKEKIDLELVDNYLGIFLAYDRLFLSALRQISMHASETVFHEISAQEEPNQAYNPGWHQEIGHAYEASKRISENIFFNTSQKIESEFFEHLAKDFLGIILMKLRGHKELIEYIENPGQKLALLSDYLVLEEILNEGKLLTYMVVAYHTARADLAKREPGWLTKEQLGLWFASSLWASDDASLKANSYLLLLKNILNKPRIREDENNHHSNSQRSCCNLL